MFLIVFGSPEDTCLGRAHPSVPNGKSQEARSHNRTRPESHESQDTPIVDCHSMPSKLTSLADAWHSDNAKDLGREIATYLSDPQTPAELRESGYRRQISRLRRENSQLQDCIDDMHEELTHLWDLNNRQGALIEDFNLGKAAFKQPPQELLRIIFDFAIPPSFLLDPSVSYGPQSPWCQAVLAKLSLTSVCRDWYRVAKDMLYEDIAFRSVGQVSALFRTLKNQTAVDFGRMIRHIGVHCIILEEYSTVFHNDVKNVVARTPRLTSVTFNSPWPSPQPIGSMFKGMSWPITHLDCGLSVDYSDLHEHFVHLSSSLISLSLHISESQLIPHHPVYTLSRLETLRCACAGTASALPRLAERLVLPSLKTFVLQFVPHDSAHTLACLAFCKIHGPNLRTLGFRPAVASEGKYRGSTGLVTTIQSILESCPLLEHLIIPGALASSPELCHPKVQWLDFWTMYADSNSSFLDGIALPNFPAVKGIRQLIVSASLLFGHIPTAIPPRMNLGDPFEFSYPGLFLRHGNNRVYRTDTVDCLGADYDEDDISDRGYVLSSDSSSDDESSGSAEVDDSDEDWEADHESNLAMYDQLLN
ncbi:hypothetical protein B0H17DRAFT_586886 [Mycena rosella]|uniref:F-box domain-containing protein n=1 Tax=Mycena rosella TaxID=1033263 RepID=A0AAD7DGI4_MYCRO|nr:hypothetical protein B0H17DRAFT_586886 [Mycena rosella]